jgi:hypothetical protein
MTSPVVSSFVEIINNLAGSRESDRHVEEQQVPVMYTPEDLSTEINEVELRLKQLQTALTKQGPASAEAIGLKLDAALEELYSLAAFVGGANDLQSDLLKERKHILHTSVLAKFEETKVESDQAWKALCAAHAMASVKNMHDKLTLPRDSKLIIFTQATDWRAYSLRRIGDAAKTQMSTFTIEHNGVESSIAVANERMTTLQCAKDDVENARAVLENNRWHTDASKMAANIGVSRHPFDQRLYINSCAQFGILTFGVWSIVGAVSPENSCTTVVGLEAQGRAIEDQLAENHSALAKTQSSLSELESRRLNLEQAHIILRIVLERIAGVDESIKQKTLEIDKMTQEIIQAKNVAEPIWKRIARLESSATMITRHAALQKEYADTIMEMCALGCMDMRRARIIDRILREISSYPVVVETKSLKAKLEEVEKTCGRMLSQGLLI